MLWRQARCHSGQSSKSAAAMPLSHGQPGQGGNMASRDMNRWETAICKVVSHDGEEEIVVRGHRLSELTGRVSFAEAMFLMLQGRLPSAAQARVLDALLVASIEHGIAPPSMISCCFASYGT